MAPHDLPPSIPRRLRRATLTLSVLHGHHLWKRTDGEHSRGYRRPGQHCHFAQYLPTHLCRPHLPCDGALHRRSRRPPGIATEGHIRLPRHPAPLRTEGGDGNWRNAHLLLPLCPSFSRQRADGGVREYACPRGALAHRDAGRSSGSQRRTDTDLSAPRRSQYPSPLQSGHGLLHLPEPAFLFRTVPDTHPAHHRLLHRQRTEIRQRRRMAGDGTRQYPHCRSRETAALYPHLLVHRYPGKLCTVRPATYPLRWQSVADECSDRALHHRYPGIGGLYLFCLSQDCLYHQCSIHGGVVGGYAVRSHVSRYSHVCARACGLLPLPRAALHGGGTSHDLLRCRICLLLAVGSYTLHLPIGSTADTAIAEMVDKKRDKGEAISPPHHLAHLPHCQQLPSSATSGMPSPPIPPSCSCWQAVSSSTDCSTTTCTPPTWCARLPSQW